MRVTLKGMLIDFIAVCANANIPIFSNVLGKETICNLVHPSKTYNRFLYNFWAV